MLEALTPGALRDSEIADGSKDLWDCGRFLGEQHTALIGWDSVQEMDKELSQASAPTA